MLARRNTYITAHVLYHYIECSIHEDNPLTDTAVSIVKSASKSLMNHLLAPNHRHQQRVMRPLLASHQTPQTPRFAAVGARVNTDSDRWMRTKKRTMKCLAAAVE